MRITAIAIFLFCALLLIHETDSYGYEGESAVYSVKPLGGRAVYQDLGLAELGGKKVRLSVFMTHTIGFKDTETIYSDRETFLPIRIERDIRRWLGRQTIVEEYDQSAFKVTITKFKGRKKIGEQVFCADGPIANAILIPLYLRTFSDMQIGWSFVFRLPEKYEARLVSIDEMRVGKKKIACYHFISVPDRFELWISKDDARIPLKIIGKGVFDYSLFLRSHTYVKEER